VAKISQIEEHLGLNDLSVYTAPSLPH
jgi:hypothetical protein